MGEFLSDVAVLCRKSLADLGARVLLADALQDLDELVERDLVPILTEIMLLAESLETFLRVVDERAELTELLLADLSEEEVLYFDANRTRSILQYVDEGFIFTVDVGEEVLGTLR